MDRATEHRDRSPIRRTTKDAALAAARDLIRLKTEVIVVASTQTALAAKEATSTIPIVMTIPSDPVATGLVASLARPGGNVTGLSFEGTELARKYVEFLKEAVPALRRLSVLANPDNASHPIRINEATRVARVLSIEIDANSEPSNLPRHNGCQPPAAPLASEAQSV